MSSDRRSEVVVYLDAPELGPRRPVGVLHAARGTRPVISFTYARSWLASRDRFPIDPALPLVDPDQYVQDGALPGILADTAPDRWGRTLFDRREVAFAREEGRRPRTLHDWDYLLGVSDVTRMGALRLAAPPGDETFLDDREQSVPPMVRLRELEHASRMLEASPSSPSSPSSLRDESAFLALLLAPGSSLGGARPKASFVAEDESLWIAKFPSRADIREIGAWEYLLTELAARAGIRVPERRLLRLGGEGRTFAARRFDRSGKDRRLYASAMTLIGKNDGEEASYLEIAMAIADHGAPTTIGQDLEQLFRRVVFNVLMANRDDHLRNHGFLRNPQGWRLAPAFDLNPTPEKAEHSLAIDARDGQPSLDLVRDTAPWYRIRRTRMDEIVDEVRLAVSTWPTVAGDLGLAAHEVVFMADALAAM